MIIETRQAPVPLCDLQALHTPLAEEIRTAIDRVIESQYFIMGPEVRELEEQIAEYCNIAHAVSCSSGTDALLLALMALDVGPGDEVITTPFTFFATAGAISRLGARPVFVDIESDGFNIDPNLIEFAITRKTKAIIPVHLFGQMAEMDPILDIAARHGLAVVEDAAQSIGAEYRTQRAGSLGTVGCFSFFPAKNLGCLGDGGMVVTGDDALADRMRALRTHGTTKKYYHAMVGGNFRLDTIQAAVLQVKLPHLDRWNAARAAVARRYRELFRDAGLDDQLRLPPELPYRRHVYNQFCVRSSRRDELVEHLQTNKIGTAVYYPRPLHLQACFQSLGFHEGGFPVSERAAKEIFAIPMSPTVSAEQQATVVRMLAQCFASGF